MRSLRTHFLILALSLVGLLTSAGDVFAARIMIATPLSPTGVGDVFIIPVTLDTQDDSINALEADISYSKELSLQEIRDGGSVVNFWVTEPTNANGTVHFAGITPGGFSGKSGDIFALVFKAVAQGDAILSITGTHTLKNDGSGTEAPSHSSSFSFTVGATGSGKSVSSLTNDKTQPESFTAAISADPSIFDGKFFLVFATQDKESGVAQYEVAEARGFQKLSYAHLSWQSATSPYLLLDQEQKSYIYVKAVDRAGNTRIEILSPAHLPPYYNLDILFAILIAFILCALWGRFYLHESRKNKHS